MQISKENYELYFVDYFEGNLSPEEEVLLMNFLNENPDLKEEFEIYGAPLKIEKSNISFAGKNNLKMPAELIDKDPDELFIDHLEGNLNVDEQKAYNLFKSSSSPFRKLHYLYQQIKFAPDTSIQYEDKNKLKITKLNLFINNSLYGVISIAASIAIVVFIAIFLSQNRMVDKTIVATTEPDSPKIVKEKTQEPDKKEKNNNLEIAEIEPERNLTEEKDTVQKIIPVKKDTSVQKAPKNLKLIIRNQDPIIMAEAKKVEISTDYSPGIKEIQLFSENEMDSRLNALQKLENKISSEREKLNVDDFSLRNIKFWDIADFSINGINKITGSKMSLEKIYDHEGNYKAWEFQSNLISIYSPAKK